MVFVLGPQFGNSEPYCPVGEGEEESGKGQGAVVQTPLPGKVKKKWWKSQGDAKISHSQSLHKLKCNSAVDTYSGPLTLEAL